MDIIGITERVCVCMSWEAESKQAVKIEVSHKKNTSKIKCISIWWDVVFLAL